MCTKEVAMTKQTIRLFIKATIVGILINIAVAQAPTGPVAVDTTLTNQDETALFQHSISDTDLNNTDTQ